jgi:hypothetical protein
MKDRKLAWCNRWCWFEVLMPNCDGRKACDVEQRVLDPSGGRVSECVI